MAASPLTCACEVSVSIFVRAKADEYEEMFPAPQQYAEVDGVQYVDAVNQRTGGDQQLLCCSLEFVGHFDMAQDEMMSAVAGAFLSRLERRARRYGLNMTVLRSIPPRYSVGIGGAADGFSQQSWREIQSAELLRDHVRGESPQVTMKLMWLSPYSAMTVTSPPSYCCHCVFS
jgi:hypothetical protein